MVMVLWFYGYLGSSLAAYSHKIFVLYKENWFKLEKYLLNSLLKKHIIFIKFNPWSELTINYVELPTKVVNCPFRYICTEN